MGKISSWGEVTRRTVEITVSGVPDVRGQGAFEVTPQTLTITYVRKDGHEFRADRPEQVEAIKIRGIRNGDPDFFGVRVWYPLRDDHDPADVPDWVHELAEIFRIHDDLADQLRAQRKLIKWLRDDS